MEENNVIICEKCYEENNATRLNCKNCGARLYKNENTSSETVSKISKEHKSKNYDQDKNEYVNASNSSNEVAEKFTLVVIITKVIGYLAAIIIGFVIMTNGEPFIGILVGLALGVVVWLSTLYFEAIAEGLNLLQDIKNKLK